MVVCFLFVKIKDIEGEFMKLKKIHGILMGILACMLWSTAFAGVKIGYRYLPAPFTFAGLRFTLAGLILIPFCWRKNTLQLLAHHRKLITYVVLLNTAVGYALYYTAMKYVAGATASIIVGTGPLITATMTHFLMEDDRMDRGKFISILTGMAGIVVIMISSKPLSPVGRMEAVGILLLLGNSALTSYANIKVAEMKGGIDGRFLTSNQMLWGGLLLLLAGRTFEGSYSLNLPLEFYMSLIWLALVSALAFSMWFVAIQIEGIKVSELNMWKFLIPVLGAVVTWIILPEENPTAVVLVGMSLVFASLVMYNINNKKKKAGSLKPE